MDKIQFRVPTVSEVDLSDIAEKFSEMDSVRQAIILEELFDALKHRCRDHFHFESQLLHIANEAKNGFHKNLFYVFETLNEFINDTKDPK